MVTQLKELSQQMEEVDVVAKFLHIVPPRFAQLAQSIGTLVDLSMRVRRVVQTSVGAVFGSPGPIGYKEMIALPGFASDPCLGGTRSRWLSKPRFVRTERT